jgi:hypothetical protein
MQTEFKKMLTKYANLSSRKKDNFVSNEKCMSINKINLPNEMIDIIKSFAFYDENTFNLKKNKKRVIETINNAYSRKYAAEIGEGDTELWVFFEMPIASCGTNIQPTNCCVCGNYKMTFNSWSQTPTNVRCYCYSNEWIYGYNSDEEEEEDYDY